ncbi:MULTISPECIES: type 1 fimbrial protein [Chromobacterium]|uniref:Type 1 fimbrial protein n=1 Tax=Chromobacterium aquaticum TaxID=467180 RepID=A0ABV8ZZ86_9NEIS|nr:MULTISPECIES: type 1 fimbrial protein [Chromobacterium]MCD5362062.1 type 1 fimbrial protein [Chromobacterium aquaticum]
MKRLHALGLAALVSAFSSAAFAQGGEVYFYGAIVEGGCSAQTHELASADAARTKPALELKECASPAKLTLDSEAGAQQAQIASLNVRKGENQFSSRELLRGATAHAGAVKLLVNYF